MDYLPLDTSPETLSRQQQLFEAAFPPNPKFSVEGLNWLYAQNPEGQAVGYDAYDGDKLVAHYACIPTRVRVEGKMVKGLLSLNTATHPDYRGKKLFEELTRRTYERAAELGYDHVQGAANAMSTPLFVRKFGYQEICQLEAKVGFGRLGVDLEVAARDATYQQIWTEESIAWRMANPSNPVTARAYGNGLGFHAKSFSSLVPAYAEIGKTEDFSNVETGGMQSPMRLYIGLFPKSAGTPKGYFEIPQKFRPSPLNFLFQSMHDSSIRSIDPDGVSYSFLDFDAY